MIFNGFSIFNFFKLKSGSSLLPITGSILLPITEFSKVLSIVSTNTELWSKLGRYVSDSFKDSRRHQNFRN